MGQSFSEVDVRGCHLMLGSCNPDDHRNRHFPSRLRILAAGEDPDRLGSKFSVELPSQIETVTAVKDTEPQTLSDPFTTKETQVTFL